MKNKTYTEQNDVGIGSGSFFKSVLGILTSKLKGTFFCRKLTIT